MSRFLGALRRRWRASYPRRKGLLESWAGWALRMLFPTQYKALAWYADEHHWQAKHKDHPMNLAQVDAGEKAREALGWVW